MLHKVEHAVGQLWGKASDNAIVAGVVATVVGGVIVAAIVAIPAGSGQKHLEVAAVSSKSPLRVEVQPKPPQFFDIAFDRNIGMPAPSEGWASLRERGGIDNVTSLSELTLANRSAAPLTVTNIEAVVLKSRPAPSAWDGSQFSQGADGLTQFSAWLTSGAPHTGVAVSGGGGGAKLNGPPYFETHYISLRPGEIYQAEITIISTVENRELEYDFAISGNTAASSFTVTTTPHLVITRRLIPSYTHRYLHISSGDESGCWIVEPTDVGFPHCR
ncbi:MAG TPA: hypothetical protein VGP18_13205 [Solirubrobacteraceae bacterium]|jgi:hypothetical protein|nr:hypothetical protein [Solirubrobacteraceae bacterium]